MTRTALLSLLLSFSLRAAMGQFDDTFDAIANCCEAGCDEACDYVDEFFDNNPARRNLAQSRARNLQSDSFPTFPLPEPGPNADLEVVNAHCCCRDSFCRGDPHFQTFSGDNYDFHGQCELVLVDAPEFGNNLGLTVHIRTKILGLYSYIESAAIKIGNGILEVSSWGEYRLNGVQGAEMPNTLGPFTITEHPNKRSLKDSILEIDLGLGQKMRIKTFKSWVSVDMMKMLERDMKNSRGLMGDFKSGAKVGRDGLTVFADDNLFGQEWQVRSEEPKLFENEVGPQYPEQCIMPTESLEQRRRLGDWAISNKQADEACSHVNGEEKKMCIFDVVHSGDIEMAQAYPLR